MFINVSKVERRIATGRSFSIRLSPGSLSHPLSRAISEQVFRCFTGDIIYAWCTHGLAKSSVFHFTLRSPRCERYRGDDARRRLRASIYFPRRSLHKSAARTFSISSQAFPEFHYKIERRERDTFKDTHYTLNYLYCTNYVRFITMITHLSFNLESLYRNTKFSDLNFEAIWNFSES